MGQRAAPAPFLTKTYELVDDPVTDDVVSWNETGTTFVVWKTADFAKDLLPNYFKHSNFSSFIRQLNTYGFRKTAASKWEFANDNFKRGEKELLGLICRRRTTTASQGARKSAPGCSQSSPSNSGEDLGSTSTSFQNFKNAGAPPVKPLFADLSDENEKLKRDNKLLVTELSQTKKECDELIALLTKYVDMAPDQIMRQTSRCGPANDGSDDQVGTNVVHGNDDDENKNRDGSLKLFGVWVKENEKKRGRDETMGIVGVKRKELKAAETNAPWAKITSSLG